MSLYQLKLYLRKDSSTYDRIISAIDSINATLAIRFELEIIDVFQEPEIAEKEKILAVPTLVRYSPLPVKRIVGNLDNTEYVIEQILHVDDPKIDS